MGCATRWTPAWASDANAGASQREFACHPEAGPWAPLAGSLRAGQATEGSIQLLVASVGSADPSQAQDDTRSRTTGRVVAEERICGLDSDSSTSPPPSM